MPRFKICPACGTKNDVTLIECLECGADIMSQPAVTEAQYEASINKTESENVSAIRICENCDASNPANARVCSSCGDDISFVIPKVPDLDSGTNEETEFDKPRFVLVTTDGTYAFKLEKDVTVVGRESGMSEYLNKKTFVSRRHCEFRIENDVLSVTDLNSSNHVFVNNQQILDKQSLKDGDEVGLGGNERNGVRDEQAAYFIVSVNPCM